MARAVIRPTSPLLIVVPEGGSQFWMLNTLNASKRNCSFHPSRGKGMLLNRERSVLNTPGPLSTLRPKFPNDPKGLAKAQGLNQVAVVRVISAARPPCEMVLPHAGSGLAGTGPACKGSAII